MRNAEFGLQNRSHAGTPQGDLQHENSPLRSFRIPHSRPSKNLARVVQGKKAPVIFERSERPAPNATSFPAKESPHMRGRFFATLWNDVFCLQVDERIGFSKVSFRIPNSEFRIPQSPSL